MPLIRPAQVPTSRALKTIAIQPMLSAMSCVPVVVAQTEARARIAPTDRSMPPPVITNVMPIDTTPTTAARRRIVSRLSVLANRSPAVMMPTTHRMIRAMTRPRLRAMLRLPPRSPRPAGAGTVNEGSF